MLSQSKKLQYSYAQEKLSAAVIKLAIGEGDIRGRLKWAHDSELCALTERNFPDDLKDDWQNIMRGLTRLGPKRINGTLITISSISNTLRKIRNATGVKIARRVVDLKYKVDNYFELSQK